MENVKTKHFSFLFLSFTVNHMFSTLILRQFFLFYCICFTRSLMSFIRKRKMKLQLLGLFLCRTSYIVWSNSTSERDEIKCSSFVTHKRFCSYAQTIFFKKKKAETKRKKNESNKVDKLTLKWGLLLLLVSFLIKPITILSYVLFEVKMNTIVNDFFFF